MNGILNGIFLALNENPYEGKKYYKALFLVDSESKKIVEYVSITDEHLEQIRQLKFGDTVSLTCSWSVYEGKGKWKY